MRTILIALLALFALFVLTHEASAAKTLSAGTYSVVTAQSATAGSLSYTVLWAQGNAGQMSTPLASVSDATYVGFDLPAGSPVVYTCFTTSTGTLPPTAATSIVVSGYADNNNLGGGGTPIWTQTLASCGGSINATTFTEYLTSTGASGASPRAGTVRILVEMVNTGIGTSYDCNSDDAGTQTPPTAGTCNAAGGTQAHLSVGRSDPGFSVFNLTGTNPCASGCHTYIGGDTLTVAVTDNATEYNSGTRLQESIATGGGVPTNVGGLQALSASAHTATSQVVGSAATWLPGAITLRYSESGFSTITGYSAFSYWVFIPATTSGATIVNANLITFDPTDILSRTLTPTNTCSATVLGTSTAVANRGQTPHVTGAAPWTDARGSNVPNNNAARGWMQRAAQYRISTDIGSFDGLFGALGSFPIDVTVTSTATVTTGLAYHKMVETFTTTARTDAVLTNWGNSTGCLDVSATFTFDSILNAKNGGSVNQSAFTISADTEHVRTQGLRDATTNFLSGIQVSCFRTRSDHVVESTVNFGNTDASGNTAFQDLSVIAPQGLWTLTCSVSSNGNTGQYVITFFFVKAFTADKNEATLFNVTTVDASTVRVNVTMHTVVYDTDTDSPTCLFPDDVVRLTVRSYNATSKDYDINETSRTLMIPSTTVLGTLGCDWSYNFTMPISNATLGMCAMETFNFTGSPFAATGCYIFNNTSGGGSAEIMGAVTFPAYDPYVPTIVWLVVLVVLLYKRIYYPAFACVLAIADQLLSYNHLTNAGFFWEIAVFVFTILLQAIARFVTDPRLLPSSKDEQKER